MSVHRVLAGFRSPDQDFVNEGVEADTLPARLLADLLEHASIDADRDQSARLITQRAATGSPLAFA
jgi:hypothetical protein